MSKQVLKNAFCEINSVDLSDHVHQLTLTLGADAVEQTAMGDGTHNYMPGLLTVAFSVEFFEDYASAKVDATLSAILAGGAAVAVIIRPDTGSVGATNPQYAGNFMLESYDGPTGTVGQAAMCKASFKPAGNVTRTTS